MRARSLAYATGNLGIALFYNTISTWLIFFYVDVVRLDARLVGLAFAISYGIWNAINDPLLGYFSDRTRTRWGRRKPWIAVSTPLTMALFILVWSPPVGGAPLADPNSVTMLIWFAVIIALFDLANSAVGVSYIALFPELFRSLEERTEVSIYRQVAAVVGSALGLAVLPLLVSAFSGNGGTIKGWSGAGMVLGAIGGVSLGVSLLGGGEKAPVEKQKQGLPFLKSFKATLGNRSFLTYMVADLMVNYIWSWLSAMVPFFCKYSLGTSDSQTSIMFGAMFGSALLFYPVWRKLALRMGSKGALSLAVGLFVVFLLPMLFVRTFIQAIFMMVVVGAAHSGTMLIREILLGDVIDEDELRTGERREGSYFGVAAFIERLVMILIGGSTSLVLLMSGYDAKLTEQPGTVGMGIRIGITLLPAVACALFLLAMRFYPLGRDRVREMQKGLADTREGKTGN